MSSLAAAKRPPPSTIGTPPARPTPAEAETMTDRGDRIREIAYFLWLDEGCPEGAAERHWLAAETLLELRASRTQAHRRRASGRTGGRCLDRPWRREGDIADPSAARVRAEKNFRRRLFPVFNP